MSIPFLTFTCSDCDLYGTTLVTAGMFSYAEVQGEQSIDRETGYCADCSGIVPCEKLAPSCTDWDAFEAELMADYPRPPPRRWYHFSRRNRPSPEMRYLRASREREDGQNRMKAAIGALREPVCLRCGGSRIMRLHPSADFADDGSLYPLGSIHPDCGGALLVHGSHGARLQPALLERGYDWRTGRQIQGPPVELEPPLLSGFSPRERPRPRNLGV